MQLAPLGSIFAPNLAVTRERLVERSRRHDVTITYAYRLILLKDNAFL